MSKIKHGHSKGGKITKIYQVWLNMRNRCNNPKHKLYKYYGERGITICERWDNFINFFTDMGECPEGLVMDRINNNGNYEPLNCRWTDTKTSNHNRRMPKLSMEEVNEIRTLCLAGHLQRAVALKFGIYPGHVSRIVNYQRWKQKKEK